eukprot:CAMPEP_0197078332 /NCGR_PEP_ID=MMETSP1384-20130603/213066_1 /TAXON_ID=29189 /ORGANISM="Ammonia sp." /LENGTH=663 /DNA_ID=CAMNT_0042517197 /DNA_START=77 /DNA_END=2068 /DNA_ORIENTATION=+
MPQRKPQYQIWFQQVKKELLLTEPQNILARSECCQNIINECISHMNMNLDLASIPPSELYTCNVAATDHLKFLLDWPGLRVDNSPKAPKTKKEYEKKSKNWLNGRRAPNYGKTLFPFFIHAAERYVTHIAKLVIPDNEPQRKLYYDMVIYKVLAQLCGCSVSLHEQAKKAPFFCKNSIERKGRLKEILQSYAADHEYIQGFPSCFEEAIGFFDKKSNEFFHEYRKQYMGFDASTKSSEVDVNATPTPILGAQITADDDRKSSHSLKSERPLSSQPTIDADAEYWKKQYLDLRRKLENEQRLRLSAERDRDNLRMLINSSSTHQNAMPNVYDLQSANDTSMTSTASTSSTSIVYSQPNSQSQSHGIVAPKCVRVAVAPPRPPPPMHVNLPPAMPCLQTQNSFRSQTSHHTHSSSTVSSSDHASSTDSSALTLTTADSMNNSNRVNNHSHQPAVHNAMPNDQMYGNAAFVINHMDHHMPTGNNHNHGNQMAVNSNHNQAPVVHQNTGYTQNDSNNAMGPSHPYGPAMPPNHFVNNCVNDYLNNDNGINQFLMMSPNQPRQSVATSAPISPPQNNHNGNMNANNMNMTAPHINMSNLSRPSLLFQNSVQDGFGMGGADNFSNIIDSMPIMSRQPQISEDSFSGFNGLRSPAPMYRKNGMLSSNDMF